MEHQAVLDRQTEYLSKLFKDNDNELLNVTTDLEPSGNSILETEVETALKDMKFEKLPTNDNVTTELITVCKETGIKNVCLLANKIYESGVTRK